MAKLEIRQFNCLSDNYGVLIHEPEANVTASIDTPEAGPIIAALDDAGWRLTHILNTHHHWDHTGGNEELKTRYGCTVVGPAGEAAKIPGIDVKLGDGDSFAFGEQTARIIETPGHTLGQIAYYFPHSAVAFTGDTLFALGCGRVFEGTPAQMWASLQKLMALPGDTRIYCGHEYTQANARFALSVDPDNAELIARAAEIDALRANGLATLPTTIALELKTNPFLRAEDPGIRAHLAMEHADAADVFAEIRKRKDNF